MRTKFTVNDESDKVDDVRANKTEVENGDILTISKIVEQKQIFEKRLKFRQVNVEIKNLIKLSFYHQDQLESSYEESTFKSEEVRQVVNYSPAAAHEVLKAIAEKTGMNPAAKVRVNGRLRKLTSKTLMQIHVKYINESFKY